MKANILTAGLGLAFLLAAGCGQGPAPDQGKQGASAADPARDAARAQALKELKAEIAALDAAQVKQAADIRNQARAHADNILTLSGDWKELDLMARGFLETGEAAVFRHGSEWRAKRNAARRRFVETWGEHPEARRESEG